MRAAVSHAHTQDPVMLPKLLCVAYALYLRATISVLPHKAAAVHIRRHRNLK